MDSVTFLNLVRGNRLSSIIGLRMREGVPYRFSKDYTYVEIPLGELFNPGTEEVVSKASRNQRIRIIPACDILLRGTGYKVIVKVNPKIHEYASCTEIRFLEDDTDQPVFYATFHKDMDAAELDWAVRLYLVG